VPLGEFKAAAIHRVQTGSDAVGQHLHTDAKNIYDSTHIRFVQGESPVCVASQNNSEVFYNTSVVSGKWKNDEFVAPNAPRTEAVYVGDAAPDVTAAPWIHTLQNGTTVRAKPKEGAGDTWVPKPYGKPYTYATTQNNDPEYPSAARYWMNRSGTTAVSWASNSVKLYANGVLYDFTTLLPDKIILAACYTTSGRKFYLLVTQSNADLGETETFKIDSYANYSPGTAVARTTKIPQTKKKDYRLSYGKPKDLFVIGWNEDLKEFVIQFPKTKVIDDDTEVLCADFIDPTILVHTVLRQTETTVHVSDITYDSNLKEIKFTQTQKHTIPSMVVSDQLTSSRKIKELIATSDTPSTSGSAYIYTLSGRGRQAIEDRTLNIAGKRVIACNAHRGYVGFLVENYEELREVNINYPRIPYTSSMATMTYPRKVLGFTVGTVIMTLVNYFGKSLRATYHEHYTRNTSYYRDVVTVVRDPDTKILSVNVDTELTSSLEASSIEITENSSEIDIGWPRRVQIDDGGTYAALAQSDFAGVDFGAVNDYHQVDVNRQELVTNVHRIYAADPVTDSYLVATTNLDFSVEAVSVEGVVRNDLTTNVDAYIRAPVDTHTFLPTKVKKRFIFFGSEAVDGEFEPELMAEVSRNNRVIKRFLGDPVDYVPVSVPYNFLIGDNWEYRTEAGTALTPFPMNFSRNYANAGLLLSIDPKKVVFSGNVDGKDCLPTYGVKSYACKGVGKPIRVQDERQYAPVTLGVK